MQTYYDKIKSVLTGKHYESRTIKPRTPEFEEHVKQVQEKYKKNKEKENKKDKDESNNGIPWPVGFTGRHPRRIEDGGMVRLKRRNA